MVCIDDVEVRISGRIDRVDLVELDDGVGFWIIDYKTGSSAHYTGTELAEYRHLQLTLYALAVEEVLLAGRAARPLGLAYWMPSESGPKIALPVRAAAKWLDDGRRWRVSAKTYDNGSPRWSATYVRAISFCSRARTIALRPVLSGKRAASPKPAASARKGCCRCR